MPIELDAAVVAARLSGLEDEIPSLRMLVLFGSVVRGRVGPSSDVDLGILCEGDFNQDALYLAIAPRLLSDRLDLVDLRRAPPILAFAVAREGRLLYEREPGTFRSFQSLAWRRYCDTEKLRQATTTGIQRFLEREGLR